MLCLGCVSKVNSENDEYQSCLPCVSKLCGCPKRVDLRSKNSGKSGATNFSVSNEIKVEVTTQGKDHDVNDVPEHERCTSSCTHSGKLKGGEGAPE